MEEDILMDLNPEQQEAVTTTEGYVRVVAGAGSGKTRALSHRFAFLVNELGILPGHILCVTFTNKSANEMRQRIHSLTGDDDTGYINTFHGFCVSVLQEDSHAVSYPKSFLVIDNSDIDDMLKIIYDERHLTLRDMTFGRARDMIEMRKVFTQKDYYLDMIAMSQEALKEKYEQAQDPNDIIFYGYLYQEKKAFALDYNDLIRFTLYIFHEHEDIRLKWQKRLEYIMIDEFQDIDALQYELMEVLSAYHRNLFVVGDPDQTIYTWRGAEIRYLMDFDKVFPGTKTILMMTNYRSTPEILSCANALIDKNTYRIKKNLIPVRESGEVPLCHHADSTEKEALWIADKVLELQKAGTKLSDITLLYRAHYVTRPIEEAFIRKKIPYTIYSGVQFFARMEIKDALSYLRMISMKDDLSFRRICNKPKRNIGEKRIAFLEQKAAASGKSLYDTLRENLDDPLFQGTGAADFVALVGEFADSYEGQQISDLFSALMNRSGYEEMLRTEGPCRLSAARRPVHQPGRGGARGQGKAHDGPHRKGPRVPRRVPRRHERGNLSLEEGEGQAGHGGGAPPCLCRADTGKGEALSHGGPGQELRRLAPVPIPFSVRHRGGEPAFYGAAGCGSCQSRKAVHRPAGAGGGRENRTLCQGGQGATQGLWRRHHHGDRHRRRRLRDPLRPPCDGPGGELSGKA